MNDTLDDRQYTRIETFLEVEMHFYDEEISQENSSSRVEKPQVIFGRIRNISAGGMYIVTTSPLPSINRFTVQVKFPGHDEKIIIPSYVKRFSDLKNGFFGLGISFKPIRDIEKEDETAIHSPELTEITETKQGAIELDTDKLRQRISRYIFNTREITTLPTVVDTLVDIANNEKSTVVEMADVIASDIALSTNILRVANSAFYGFNRNVESVKQAILLIGFNPIVNLAISTSVMDLFGAENLNSHIGKFWFHSWACGSVARILAPRFNLPKDICFTAGLLHDIGKLIIKNVLPIEFNRIVEKVEKSKLKFLDIEREILGIDHQEVGFLCCQKWNFPDNLRETTLNHHFDFGGNQINSPLVALIHLSDNLCNTLKLGNIVNYSPSLVDNRALAILKIDKKLEDQIQLEIRREKDLIQNSFRDIYGRKE